MASRSGSEPRMRSTAYVPAIGETRQAVLVRVHARRDGQMFAVLEDERYVLHRLAIPPRVKLVDVQLVWDGRQWQIEERACALK